LNTKYIMRMMLAVSARGNHIRGERGASMRRVGRFLIHEERRS